MLVTVGTVFDSNSCDNCQAAAMAYIESGRFHLYADRIDNNPVTKHPKSKIWSLFWETISYDFHSKHLSYNKFEIRKATGKKWK